MPSSSATGRTSSRSRSLPSQCRVVGVLEQIGADGRLVSVKQILPGKELLIGRDRSKCQVFIDDPYVSAKHLRVYSIVYDDSDATEIDTLVYAEDLSRHGTFWNGSFIGRGNGGFLLSPGDVLKLSAHVSFLFKNSGEANDVSQFDLIQENEMQKFRDSYIVTDRLLGSGAFGKVFMAIEQATRTQLACKVVDLRRLRPASRFGRKEEPLPANEVDCSDQLRKVKKWADQQKRENKLEEKLKIYYREADILASIRHPNIIGLEKVFVTDNTIYMFEDLVTGGDLFSYLESKNSKLSEVEAAVIIRQIVVALCFLHEKNIVHRDLKPDNILMTSLSTGCRVLLTDFGAARRLDGPRHRMLSMAGTDEYAAPEVTADGSTKSGYTKAVDLWSLGCVAAILLTGASAFTDPETRQHSPALAKKCSLHFLRQSTIWQNVRPRPKDFVERLLVLTDDDRMTATQALEHGWFSNDLHKTNFEELYQRAIRHWRPRPTRADLFEFSGAYDARKVARTEGVLAPRKPRNQGPRPGQIVESHYKPFPRQMHTSIWPRRRPSASYIAPETKAAIEANWPFPIRTITEKSGADPLSEAKLKRRSSFPSADPQPLHCTSTAQQLPPPANRLTSKLSRVTVPLRLAKPNRFSRSAIETSSPRSHSPSPTTETVGSHARVPKLRRRSSPAEDRQLPALLATPSKRRRDSVFDLDDEKENRMSLTVSAHKRSRHDEDYDETLPHHVSAFAEGDLE